VKGTIASLALLLAVGACGDDDASTTGADTTTPPTGATTSAPGGGQTTQATTTSAGGGDSGPTDCQEIWPETAIQEVAGPPYTFFAANADSSACTYLDEAANGIALAWRASTRAEYEQSRAGAASTGGGVTDLDLCDGAFYTELQPTTLIMEVYSEANGRAYTATISGAPIDDAIAWASALLTSTC